MTIGIVGLGLIGGSIAKAVRQNTEHTVLGMDIAESVVLKAKLLGAIDGELCRENLPECGFVIIALYPGDAIKFIRENAALFQKNALVVDCCGVKREICAAAEPLAREHGFIFVGGHPMAGIERSGFENSIKTLFNHASMILTPPTGISIQTLAFLKGFFLSLGFGQVKLSSPEEHDRMIAFTSQLAHVVSSAYIKSDTALTHTGFSAGSFRDMTRVATLKEDMWTELFLCDADNLVAELDGLISRLGEYREAIHNADAQTLECLLRDGREKKALAMKAEKAK